MSFLDMFRVNKIKAELDQTKADHDALKATLSNTEHLEHYELLRATEELARKKAELEQAIADLDVVHGKRRQGHDRELAELERQVKEKRKELVLMDDEILLQSFGFYKPKYDLMNSEAYKARLEQVRAEQAALIKSGRATNSPTNMTMNNSLKEGERMIKDNVKLIVRSFNNECDASIVNVKFSNLDATEKRIRKAFDALNQLARRLGISLTQQYLDLKLQELYLVHEYAIKKQEEKEEQKRLREQLREEAKLQREIEDAKLKLDKEEKHFVKALAAMNAQLARAGSDAERELLEKERASIEQELAELAKARQDVLNRERNTRAGYVYIISNIGAFGENVYKIGVTRRLDPQERVDELGDASVPFDFDIHALIFSEDAPALENALHRAFEKRRLNMINQRREFFNVTLDEIEQVVRKNFSKPVEFVVLADAPEYRQSALLRNGTPPAA
jgi:hypothetical protein